MDTNDIVSVTSFVIGVVSLMYTIAQYVYYQKEKKALKAEMQCRFNQFCQIARAYNEVDLSKFTVPSEEISYLKQQVHYMRGVADSARSQINSYCLFHLKFKPTYEHPLFPGEVQDESVLLGHQPHRKKETPIT